MNDAPASEAHSVELELVRELIEARADSLCGSGISSELVPAISEQRGSVECPFSDKGLRIDHEPRFAFCSQDVAPVEVLVHDDEVVLRRRQLVGGVRRRVDELAFERPAEPLPLARELVGPARRFRRKQAIRVTLWWRPPDAAEQPGCDRVCLALVLELPERRTRMAALDQQRAPLGIMGQESHRAASVPKGQCVGLVLRLLIREVDLQDGVAGWDDERHVAGGKRRFELELPLLGALVGESGKLSQPGGAAGLVAPPREARGKLYFSSASMR